MIIIIIKYFFSVIHEYIIISLKLNFTFMHKPLEKMYSSNLLLCTCMLCI